MVRLAPEKKTQGYFFRLQICEVAGVGIFDSKHVQDRGFADVYFYKLKYSGENSARTDVISRFAIFPFANCPKLYCISSMS